MNGILLVPLRYPMLIDWSASLAVSPGRAVAMSQQVRTMGVAWYAEGHDFNFTGQGEPVRLTGTLVSAELF